MSEPDKSIYQQYEEATRAYYGGDTDPLRYAPPVTNENVAHELALQIESHLGTITEDEIASTALRAQARNRLPGVHGSTDLEELKQQALKDHLNMAVTNVEMTHARLSPGDFNQDSRQSGAFNMGAGIKMPGQRQPRHDDD